MCIKGVGFLMIHILFMTLILVLLFVKSLIAKSMVALISYISSIGGNQMTVTCQGNFLFYFILFF